MLTVAAEATAPAFGGTDRHIYHRTGRPACKQPDLLESTSQRSTAARVPPAAAVRVVWTRRYLLSQVGDTIVHFYAPQSDVTRFNWAHRKLYNRLIQLGAHPFCDRGESDEQHPEG